MERFKIQSLNRQELPEKDGAHVDTLRISVKMASQGKTKWRDCKNNQPVDCAQWKVMECDGRKVVRAMCAQFNDS